MVEEEQSNLDIVQEAIEQFNTQVECWGDIYAKAKDDLYFLSDEEGSQWDADIYADRVKTGRPALQVNQLVQYVHQVTNDMRQNTPSIKIIPNGAGSDKETAEIFQGLVRNIEYESDADQAYDNAADFAVKSSIGFIRVDHDYVDEETFEQKLCIKRVVDPSLVYLDYNSIEADGSDAKIAFVLEDMDNDSYKDAYPDASRISFPVQHSDGKKDGVWIAECFKVEEQEGAIVELVTGEIIPQDQLQPEMEFAIQSVRKVKKRIIKRFKMNGQELLEETVFPGKYIPIVPVYGEESWREGKRHLESLIRRSKDSQKLYNYMKSVGAEVVLKQAQAPFMVANESIDDFAVDWKNPSKSMALRYKAYDERGNPLPKPERIIPPQTANGILTEASTSLEDIKNTMGMHNAALGMAGNEISGIAVNERKKEGDTATYHFADNLQRAIQQVGRILVNAIPEIYDTERVIKIVDAEEESQEVGINGMLAEGQERPYDLKNGRYDVKVVTGASFTTKRQEEAQFMTELVSSNPELMYKIGDLLFKSLDLPGAEQVAERMRRMIDPALLEEEQISPETIALRQQLEQSQVIIQQLQQALEEAQGAAEDKEMELLLKAEENAGDQEVAESKLELEELKVRIDAYKAETDRLKALRETPTRGEALEQNFIG